MPTSTQILEMLKQLEIRDVPYRSTDGGNYINDHTPMDSQNTIKKIELFISFGGKVISQYNRISVAWTGHSEGELEVFRVGEDKYFLHGEIMTG